MFRFGVIGYGIMGKLEGHLVYMLNLFLDALEGKRENPVPLEDGLLNGKILSAVNESLEKGGWVEIKN